VIVTGRLQATVIALLQAIATVLARVIEIGRKLATVAVAKMQAKGRLGLPSLLRKQVRSRAVKQVRKGASGRASRSATPRFQMSNQDPRLVLKPIAAAKALAVVEERPASPPTVVAEEEHPA
jgi:hypothetical protein